MEGDASSHNRDATVSLYYCAAAAASRRSVQRLSSPNQHGTEQLILPDTFFIEATFPLVDVLLDPVGEGATLERRGERKVLRGSGCADRQSVNQLRLHLSYPHPGGNMGGYGAQICLRLRADSTAGERSLCSECCGCWLTLSTASVMSELS